MAVGDGLRPEVESGGAPDAVGEVSLQVVVVIEKGVEAVFVVHEELGGPCGEGSA